MIMHSAITKKGFKLFAETEMIKWFKKLLL